MQKRCLGPLQGTRASASAGALCPYCIRGHTKAAMRHGATREELMEAIWVAAEMCAGGAYTHSALALDEMEKASPRE